MPGHYAPLVRKRLGEQVVDGYDRWQDHKDREGKTENVSNFYIESTTSTRVQPLKRKRDHLYATASELPLSQLLSQFSPRARRHRPKVLPGTYDTTKLVWVRQHSAR